MTNAPETQGRKPGEQTDAAPFFPSEGRFSTVVPLSQVGETQAASSEAQASSLEAQASSSKSAGEPEEHEETTLVPARTGHAHGLSAARASAGSISVAHAGAAYALRPKGFTQSWPVTTVAVVLSVVAGLIAGAYLVGSKRAVEMRRPVVNDATAEQVATGVAASESATTDAQTSQPAPDSAVPSLTAETASTSAPAAHDVADNEANAKAETEDAATRAPKAAPRTASDAAHTLEAEPTVRRTINADPRPERTARAAVAEERNTPPATRLTQRDNAAATTTSRRAQVAERRAPAPVVVERNVPVSAPPASSKSRKVIQWP
ncbi:MAG: hypothetical protein QOE46_2774 [Acidobacteriota bacterium]|jgi:hypothetical protein|nr:hypothetical protein [Acidobacteriota bacterium]